MDADATRNKGSKFVSTSVDCVRHCYLPKRNAVVSRRWEERISSTRQFSAVSIVGIVAEKNNPPKQMLFWRQFCFTSNSRLQPRVFIQIVPLHNIWSRTYIFHPTATHRAGPTSRVTQLKLVDNLGMRHRRLVSLHASSWIYPRCIARREGSSKLTSCAQWERLDSCLAIQLRLRQKKFSTKLKGSCPSRA